MGPKPPASQHSQNWSATWTKDNKRRDKRWVKYEGIGPVDESGMPIAPRSVSPGLRVQTGPEMLLSSISMSVIGVGHGGHTHTLCLGLHRCYMVKISKMESHQFKD